MNLIVITTGMERNMFKVESYWSEKAASDDAFATYEDAIAYAEEMAGKCYEGRVYTVSDVKVAMKADRPVFPVVTVDITKLKALSNKEED